jgi:Tol biopolymer transport system component
VDLDRREERRLTFDRKGITGLEWTPDGREILFISNRSGPYRLWRIDARGGSPHQINLDLDIESFSLSPDGRTILYTQQLVDSQIEIFSINGRRKGGSGDWRSGASCLIDSSREDQSPRFSPDGKRVVFESSQTGAVELWLANSDCTQLTQLTRFEQPGVVGSARWSPDGSRIVFDRHANGEVDLYSIDVNGGNLRRLTTSPTTDILPDWSPDGRSIYFTSRRSGAWNIWKMAFPVGEAVQVTRYGGWESIVSADHRLLFFTRADTLWQKDLLSGEESIIPELAEIQVERNWALTNQALFYIPRRFLGSSTIYRFDLLTRQIRQVHQIEGILARSLPSIAVAPDESRIAVSTFSYRLGDIWQLDEWR